MDNTSECNNVNIEPYKFIQTDSVNYYCDINFDPICRLCLERSKHHKKMCNIFDGPEPLYTMIMSVSIVQVSKGDGLPNTICQKCLSKLNAAWQFKIQCESSDSRLRQFYTNSLELMTPSSSHQFDDVVDESSLNGSSTQLNLSTLNVSAQAKKEPKPEKKKEYQCETCGKIFQRRAYLGQHSRLHTGERPFCCHLCDKRFVNSGHLITHMRTHTGERPHKCARCPKAFRTRQELHKHTMVHNKLRPFVCNQCGKRFGNSSNLYAHQRHHKGEKRFTCAICSKLFFSNSELKQHILIHTGEKPYTCQHCGYGFTQSAHLKRHLKLHAPDTESHPPVKYWTEVVCADS